jgi:tRNA G18 (ribose-2'-O)-methylase SpoU
MGHALTIPFTQIQNQSDWIPSLHQIQDAGFTLLALTPSSDALDINELAQNTPSESKIALIFGAEGPGLTQSALSAANQKVQIPLVKSADSLNIAVAAAVALHRLIPPKD